MFYLETGGGGGGGGAGNTIIFWHRNFVGTVSVIDGTCKTKLLELCVF